MHFSPTIGSTKLPSVHDFVETSSLSYDKKKKMNKNINIHRREEEEESMINLNNCNA